MTSTSRLVLATPMGYNDAGAATVAQYLAILLDTVWDEGEAFSGKRPFGSSGWHHEVYRALAAAGHIAATEDPDGGYTEMDTDTADQLIRDAIRTLGDV